MALVRAANPTFIYPTHFGIKPDGAAHFDSQEENIYRISTWIKDKESATIDSLVPPFQDFMHELLSDCGLAEEAIQGYVIADAAFMSVYGLAGYWKKRGTGTSPA